jgi:TPR repeat protein
MLLGAALASLYAQITLKNMSLGPEAARKCAERGDADCQAKLGWFYEDGGDGVEEDHPQAIKWYRRAAEQGLIAAQMALAATYEGGYHVPQDYAEAAKWYQAAAERGDIDGQRKIAYFYWMGKGVPRDLVRAHMWANLHAAGEQSRYQDNIRAVNAGPGTPKEKEDVVTILKSSRPELVRLAIETRTLIEQEMTQAQIADAQRLAREWEPIKGR